MLRIMLALWLFVLLALAASRATRLVTIDRITVGLRRWAVHRYGETSKIAYLLNCPFCVGFWFSLLATIYWIVAVHPSGWLWGPAWFAMSYLVAPILLRVGGD